MVKCSNRLYDITLKEALHAYIAVDDFTVKVFNKCPGEKEGTLGLGENKDIFKAFCNVLFDISNQPGNNVTYFYDFGYVSYINVSYINVIFKLYLSNLSFKR